MADYYPLLRKAIDRVDSSSEAERYNLYERARQALVGQLRGSGIVDDKLDEHLKELDRAVAKIEREFAYDRAEPTRLPPAAREEEPQTTNQEAGQPQRPAEVQRELTIASSLRGWAVLIGITFMAVLVAAGVSLYHFKPISRPGADRASPAPGQPASRPTAVASTQETVQPSYILRRQRVFYRTTHPPGTIAISQSQRFLYVVQPNQVAIRYAIGIGAECDKIAGLFHITEKVPRPADTLTARAPGAAVLPNAQFNPPALYFDSGRAVHEALDPNLVGRSARSGCFQSWDRDIADLFDRVSVNDRVVVAN